MSVRRWLSLACAKPVDLAALALWCQAFTPLTAPDPPDGVLLDITGCAHLFGGENGLKARLSTRLPYAQMAIADTPAAAWALARYEGPLPDLSLEALRLPPKTIAKLRRIGVRTIGQLTRLPEACAVGVFHRIIVADFLSFRPNTVMRVGPPIPSDAFWSGGAHHTMRLPIPDEAQWRIVRYRG